MLVWNLHLASTLSVKLSYDNFSYNINIIIKVIVTTCNYALLCIVSACEVVQHESKQVDAGQLWLLNDVVIYF